jgi:hypothetical protein
VYSIDFDVADKFLQILRADFFNKINIVLPENISDRNLKFMMHLNRVLTKKVRQIFILGKRLNTKYNC